MSLPANKRIGASRRLATPSARLTAGRPILVDIPLSAPTLAPVRRPPPSRPSRRRPLPRLTAHTPSAALAVVVRLPESAGRPWSVRPSMRPVARRNRDGTRKPLVAARRRPLARSLTVPMVARLAADVLTVARSQRPLRRPPFLAAGRYNTRPRATLVSAYALLAARLACPTLPSSLLPPVPLFEGRPVMRKVPTPRQTVDVRPVDGGPLARVRSLSAGVRHIAERLAAARLHKRRVLRRLRPGLRGTNGRQQMGRKVAARLLQTSWRRRP